MTTRNKNKSRMCSAITVLLAGLWVVSALGCLHAPDVERTRFYSVAPRIEMPAAQPLPLTLGIRPLFASRAYGAPMAYLDDNHQIGYRTRDEWAEPPATVVTRAISDALVASGRFADVGNAADMTRPELLLTGELRIYHENRTIEPHVAEIEVRVELRQSAKPGSVYAATIHETEPIASDSPLAFAEAMNLAVARLSTQIAESIAQVELGEATSAPQPEGALRKK